MKVKINNCRVYTTETTFYCLAILDDHLIKTHKRSATLTIMALLVLGLYCGVAFIFAIYQLLEDATIEKNIFK